MNEKIIQTMSFDSTKIQAANQQLEKMIIKDRTDWGDKISVVITDSKDMTKLAECQVLMLSYRQILLDKMSEFKGTVFKRNATWERYFKDLYREYSVNYDIKLNNAEKSQFIKADLSELRAQIELLEQHISFYQECIRTLDNMAFAIRNRIKLNDDEF